MNTSTKAAENATQHNNVVLKYATSATYRFQSRGKGVIDNETKREVAF